jgi:hypothetical protein
MDAMSPTRDEQLECVECGYDFTGLPSRGNCPECGRRYDLTTGAGTQYDAGRFVKAERRLGQIKTWALIAGGAGLFALCVLIESLLQIFQATDRSIVKSPILWTGGVVATILVLTGILSYLSRREE